jgi:hypothetical protein
MLDDSPDSSHSNPKKRSNPFKKILDDVKKLVKKDEAEDKNLSSFEASKNEKNKESNQHSGSSNIPKIETPETKETERSMRAKKAKVKEEKLPKKYRKGW